MAELKNTMSGFGSGLRERRFRAKASAAISKGQLCEFDASASTSFAFGVEDSYFSLAVPHVITAPFGKIYFVAEEDIASGFEGTFCLRGITDVIVRVDSALVLGHHLFPDTTTSGSVSNINTSFSKSVVWGVTDTSVSTGELMRGVWFDGFVGFGGC